MRAPLQPHLQCLLTRAMVQAGLLSTAQALAVESAAGTNGMTAGPLLESGLIDSNALAQFCAAVCGYPCHDLSTADAPACPTGLIDAVARASGGVASHGADANDAHWPALLAPVALEGQKLLIAIADPGVLPLLDKIGFRMQLTVTPVFSDYYRLLNLLAQRTAPTGRQRHIYPPPALPAALLKHPTAAAPGTPHTLTPATVPASGVSGVIEKAGDETAAVAPVVRFLQRIFDDAVRRRASDIHFEPYEKLFRIRFRIDGVLTEVATPPLAIRQQLMSRIKVIAGLDIAEKRLPQDGRMRLSGAAGGHRDIGDGGDGVDEGAFKDNRERGIDCRVSTLPTLCGEKIVIRLLESDRGALALDALGLEPDQLVVLMAAIGRPHGMILVTGPTGSGKSRTLYACLAQLNRADLNIASAEDPAEIHLAGVNQVSLNQRAGLTFPVILRAFLRQDPDVIMIGEIRDAETAAIALKAAQTGHLVLSTLHTNDAAASLARLAGMGIEAFNLASSVQLIVAQRLLRRLCVCKRPALHDRATLLACGLAECGPDERTNDHNNNRAAPVYEAAGCPRCHGSGYLGRVAIYQMLPVTAAIERLILDGCDSAAIGAAARRQGMRSLRAAGLRKMMDGVTSLAEVLCNTNPAPDCAAGPASDLADDGDAD